MLQSCQVDKIFASMFKPTKENKRYKHILFVREIPNF